MTVPRAVLFDVGDTLVERPTVGPGRRIAEALGLSRDAARAITRIVFRERFEEPRALAVRLRDALSLPRVPEPEVVAIWHAQEGEPIEVAGASACVARVRAAGARIGIVSNIWHPYAEGFRRACPTVPPLVESWQLSYRTGMPKPDPAMFASALRALGVAPADAVMVGDDLDKDVHPALALGMRAVWMTRGRDAGGVPTRCEPAADFADVERLLGV
jgi:FMN phosphatase YigB (HAD superfamily)